MFLATFNADDGTRVSAFTPQNGAAFIETNGALGNPSINTWKIYDKRARLIERLSGRPSIVSDAGSADQIFEFNWTVPYGDFQCAFMFNYTRFAQCWLVRMSNVDGADQLHGTRLWKQRLSPQDGGNIELQGVQTHIPHGTTARMRVEAIGDQIRVFMESTLLLDYTETNRTYKSVTGFGFQDDWTQIVAAKPVQIGDVWAVSANRRAARKSRTDAVFTHD